MVEALVHDALGVLDWRNAFVEVGFPAGPVVKLEGGGGRRRVSQLLFFFSARFWQGFLEGERGLERAIHGEEDGLEES